MLRLVVLLSELQQLLGGPELARVVGLAAQAERIGFDAVFFGEHVVMGPESLGGGTPEDAHAPLRPGQIEPSTEWLDPFVALGAIAGATTSIGLGTAILIAPLRPAALVASMAASLDVLSRGRLELGLGVSWQRHEYDALGVPFELRGRRLDDALDAWPPLWGGQPVTMQRESLALDRVTLGLRPVAGRIPLWFGGAFGARMVRRVVAHGSGLAPLPRANPEQLGSLVDAMRTAGREPDELDLITGIRPVLRAGETADLAASMSTVPELAAAGYTTFVLWPNAFTDDASQLPDVLAEAHRIWTSSGAASPR